MFINYHERTINCTWPKIVQVSNQTGWNPLLNFTWCHWAILIIACNHLPFFEIFSNFVHFYPNFQIFYPVVPFFNTALPFFWKTACMSLLSRIGPVSCNNEKNDVFKSTKPIPVFIVDFKHVSVYSEYFSDYHFLFPYYC